MSDTTTPAKDPRLVEAEIALAEANARKAAAEAAAAEVKALLPELPKEVTAGSLTTPESPPPIATVAAYNALAKVGSKIAAKLPATGTVWIVPDGGFQTAIETCDELVGQVERLVTLAQDAVPKLESRAGAGFAPTAFGVQLAAAAVPLLMSLFATSRTVVSAEVTVGFSSAAAAVAAAPSERQVYVLGVTPPPPTAVLKDLIKRLRDARDALDKALVDARGKWASTSAEAMATAKAEAWKVALTEDAKRNLDRADELVEKIAAAVGSATEARNETARLGHVLKSCEQLLQTIDEVLQRVSGSSGAAVLAQCALGAALKGAHILVLQPTFTGAESIYEDVKLQRDRALHLGSSVVTWYLLEKSQDAHELRASGIEWAHAAATTKVGLPDVTWASEHQSNAPAGWIP